MDHVYVAPRASQRHPDVTEEDAKAAWMNALVSRARIDKNPNEYVAIGPDDKGRLLEVVAKRNVEGDWLIYHAQTPPQKSARRELGLS